MEHKENRMHLVNKKTPQKTQLHSNMEKFEDEYDNFI